MSTLVRLHSVVQSIHQIDWEKLVRVLSALLTPAIALLTAYIAWQQHKTNRNQFCLALLERRMNVFNGTAEFIARVITQANVQVADLISFFRQTRESEFLFGADIAGYLKEIYDNGANLHALVAAQNPANAAAQTQILTWFSGQRDEALKRFGQYMAFKKAD